MILSVRSGEVTLSQRSFSLLVSPSRIRMNSYLTVSPDGRTSTSATRVFFLYSCSIYLEFSSAENTIFIRTSSWLKNNFKKFGALSDEENPETPLDPLLRVSTSSGEAALDLPCPPALLIEISVCKKKAVLIHARTRPLTPFTALNL